ncbi:MAG: hypothetical protein ACKOC0_15405 [Cytophagales bacterium]
MTNYKQQNQEKKYVIDRLLRQRSQKEVTSALFLFTRHFAQHPKFLFLIDGLGALLTTSLLFFALRANHHLIGIPQHIIGYLASIAFLYFIFSSCCFSLVKLRKRKFLTVIGAANFLYCILTLSLMILYRDTITFLGIAYFSIEILIIAALSIVELQAGQTRA